MNNPQLYVLVPEDTFPYDTENWQVGSNFDYLKEAAGKNASPSNSRQIIYKLVPVCVISLKVTTEVIVEDKSNENTSA